jgi:tetratricopeptide (TPR) repeat protein
MVKVKKPVKKTAAAPDKKKKSKLQQMEPQDWKWALIAIAITFLAFVMTFSHDFVNWDDDYNLANNANTALLNWDNIVNIFTEPVIGNYNPLPILTFAIERKFFDLDPTIYHVNNVLLHLVCVFFVYRICKSLNLSSISSAIGALLFGIHPMRVESVAWVTERKDVLFGVFFLSALWYYIQYVRSGTQTRKYFYFALGLFIVSLFAKIQAVSLPLAMLLVDYYFKRPLKLGLVLEKWMFFLASLAIGLVGIYFLRDQGSINDTTTYTLIERIMIGGYSLGVYLIKFIFPYQMSPLYPYPAELPWYIYLGSLAFVAIAAFVYIGYKKDWRPYVFGMLFFLFNVMFVLQVVGAGQGFLADRFTYIPYLGLMFIAVYALDSYMKENASKGKYALYGMSGILVLYLIMTFNQAKIWKNSDTLWTHVLKSENKTPLPYRNRANYRRDEQRYEEALADYSAAIALKPDGALYNSRAKLYFNLQKYPEAMENYNLAIGMDSTKGEYYVNRGAVFALTNQLQRSLQDFDKGLALAPDHANGYKNRSLVYQSFGQFDKALADVTTYLTMHPEDADLWYESGRLKNALNNGSAALPDLERAIQLNNRQGLYHYEKLKSYLLLGQKAQALQMVPIVQQFGVQIEPEVQAKLNG